MTFVGKILVILITVFAMFFLAVSTVVFMTEKNWKDESTRLKSALDKATTAKNDTNTKLEEAKKDFQTAQDKFTEQTKILQARIDELTKQNETRQTELTDTRGTAAKAQEDMRRALNEAEARKKETDGLREILTKVQQQANEFKIRQTELEDTIRTLQLQFKSAADQNKDLRNRVAVFSSELRRRGGPEADNFEKIKGVNTAPPDVEGQVKRVDARNERVEISIGSDDGLVVGHELEIWRTNPAPDYIGRIRIVAVDPDQAVGVVIGKTIQGKKIQEGDSVAPKIRPR